LKHLYATVAETLENASETLTKTSEKHLKPLQTYATFR
jgi:uncharacterized protein YciI